MIHPVKIQFFYIKKNSFWKKVTKCRRFNFLFFIKKPTGKDVHNKKCQYTGDISLYFLCTQLRFVFWRIYMNTAYKVWNHRKPLSLLLYLPHLSPRPPLGKRDLHEQQPIKYGTTDSRCISYTVPPSLPPPPSGKKGYWHPSMAKLLEQNIPIHSRHNHNFCL